MQRRDNNCINATWSYHKCSELLDTITILTELDVDTCREEEVDCQVSYGRRPT